MQKTFLLVVLCAILVAIGAAIYSAHEQTSKLKHTLKQSAAQQNQEALGENVTFTVTEDQHKKWTLKVKKAHYFKDQSGANLETVWGEFYDEKGNPVATFNAPRGKFLNTNKSVILQGGVLAQATDKDRGSLTADEMTWTSQAKQVDATGHIKLYMGDKLQATAKICRFTLDFSNISLIGQAASTMKL